jgi:type IV pilus assembly protein PilE
MSVRGVTLLEILLVTLIVGIIAALALPGYRHHLLRVNRTEAMTTLYAILAAEQRFHLRQGRYTADLFATPPDGLGLAKEARLYAFTVELAEDGQSFIARAIPLPAGAQAADVECQSFSLDHQGRRAVSGRHGVPRCWR